MKPLIAAGIYTISVDNFIAWITLSRGAAVVLGTSKPYPLCAGAREFTISLFLQKKIL